VPTIGRDGIGDGGKTYFVIVAVVEENALFAGE
jgi:hypothetical protein